MGADKGKPRSGVQSVELGARILAAFASVRGPISLTELSRAVGVPPGKVHRYLVSLGRSGLVEQQTVTGKYELGPLSLRIGLSAIGALDPVRYASEALPRLRDTIGHTILLTVWGDRGPTVIRLEESGDSITMNMRVGSVLSVLTTAIGHVFLAYLPRSSTQKLIDEERDRKDETQSGRRISDLDPDAISAEVRRQGLAAVDSAILPNVVAVAAPVFDYQRALVAVVGTTGLKPLLDTRPDGPVARALLDTTARISGRLGFDTNAAPERV